MIKVGAFAVIFDDQEQVLLCHRRDIDAWNLPGGGVEQGESPWDAVLREVREEVRLEVEVVRLTGLYWKPDDNEIVFNFECRSTGGSPSTSDEADEVSYFALSEIPTNLSPRQVERIADALARSASIVMKTQTGPDIRDLLRSR